MSYALHCRLFGHASWHFGPMAGHQRPKVCDRCLQPIGYALDGEMKTDGPQQVAPVVAGQPSGKAVRVVRENVRSWKVSNG